MKDGYVWIGIEPSHFVSIEPEIDRIWVCEMDYEASDLPGSPMHPWRYYVLAKNAMEAEFKVVADRASRVEVPHPGARVVLTFECPSGIV